MCCWIGWPDCPVTWSHGLDADVRRQPLGGEEKLWDVGGPQQSGGQDQHLQRSTAVEKSAESIMVRTFDSMNWRANATI